MNEKTFIVTTWEGDIYVLKGYKSAEEITDKIAGLKRVRMPNGALISESAIAKIQTIEDYKWQADQKSRHKRGQRLGGKELERWIDPVDHSDIAPSKISDVAGVIANLPQAGRLTGGKP